MTISTKYTNTNLSKYRWKILFMSVQNVTGPLVRPKGITKNSYEPYLVTHVVFGFPLCNLYLVVVQPQV